MRRLNVLFLLICLCLSLFAEPAWATEEAQHNVPIDISTCQIYTRPKYETAFRSPSDVVMVYDGEKLLRRSHDYLVTSNSAVQDDGSINVTVTGIGDYTGSVEVFAAIKRVEQPLLVNGVPQDPILPGQSIQIEASGIGEIQYASDDPSIAKVDAEGLIHGKGAGLTSITVSASGNEYYKPAERKIAVRVINPGQKPDSLPGQNAISEIDKDFNTYLSNLYLLWNFLNSRDLVQRWTTADALWRYEDARQLEELRIMIEARNADEARGTTECVTICKKCGEETTTDSQICTSCGQALQTQSGS